MKAVKPVLSVYLVAIATVVGVYFTISPLVDGVIAGHVVWDILNFFMAAGVLIALGFSYVRKREVDGSGSGDVWARLAVNALFYAALWLTIWFFWNWFVELMDRDWSHLWKQINPLFAIVVGVAGARMWREARDSEK